MDKNVLDALNDLLTWAQGVGKRRIYLNFSAEEMADAKAHPANLGDFVFSGLGSAMWDGFYAPAAPAHGRLGELSGLMAATLSAYEAMYDGDARAQGFASQAGLPAAHGFEALLESCGAHFMAGIQLGMRDGQQRGAAVAVPSNWMPSSAHPPGFAEALPGLLAAEAQAGEALARQLLIACQACPPAFLRGVAFSLGQESGLGHCDRFDQGLACARGMGHAGPEFFRGIAAICALADAGCDVRALSQTQLFSAEARDYLVENRLTYVRKELTPKIDEAFSRIAAVAQAQEIREHSGQGALRKPSKGL